MPRMAAGAGGAATYNTYGMHTADTTNDQHAKQPQPPLPVQRHHDDGTTTTDSELLYISMINSPTTTTDRHQEATPQGRYSTVQKPHTNSNNKQAHTDTRKRTHNINWTPR